MGRKLKINRQYWHSVDVRLCSNELKGILIQILIILDESNERGSIRWPLNKLANAVNATENQLEELISYGLLKGADIRETVPALIYAPKSCRKSGLIITVIAEQPGPLWYVPMLVIDEYKRTFTHAKFKELIKANSKISSKTTSLLNRGEFSGEITDEFPEKSTDFAPSAYGNQPDPVNLPLHTYANTHANLSNNEKKSTYLKFDDNYSPITPFEWIEYFRIEESYQVNSASRNELTWFEQMVAVWIKQKITVGEIRAICKISREYAAEQIYNLPAYANSALKNKHRLD